MDLTSANLIEEATKEGFYTDTSKPFSFKDVFTEKPPSGVESSSPSCRFAAGKDLIQKFASDGKSD